jgi:hypothetical protein
MTPSTIPTVLPVEEELLAVVDGEGSGGLTGEPDGFPPNGQ